MPTAEMSGQLKTLGSVLGTLLLIAAVAWLLITGQHVQNPWTSENYVEEATIKLSDEEQSVLLTRLEEIARAVGITEPINLNGYYKPDQLNIYLVSEASTELHGIASGDARYEAGSDIILLSERMFRPFIASSEYASILTVSPSEQSTASYLWFAFSTLHELAHKLNHRDTLISRNRTYDARTLEYEADDFALTALAKLVSGSEDAYDQQFAFSVQRVESLPDEDRSKVIALALIQAFSISLLFSDTNFSPFFNEQAHDEYVERFRPHIARLLSEMVTWEGRTLGILALEYMDRVAVTGRHVRGEILCNDQIDEVHIVDGGLMVTTANGQTPTLVKWESDSSGSSGSSVTVRCNLDRVLDDFNLSPPNNSEFDHQASWVSGVSPEVVEEQFYDQYPSAKGLYEQCSILDEVEVVSVRAILPFGCLASYSIEPSVDLYLASIGSNVGDIKFDLDARQYIPLEDQQGQLIILDNPTRDTYQVFDTLVDQGNLEPHFIELWKISGSPPRPIASQRLITDLVPRGEPLYNWLRISHPPVLSCQMHEEYLLTCIDFMDSVFIFDLTNETGGVLFYPAGAHMIYLGEAKFAFYATGGYRVFLAEWQSP